MKRLLHLTSLLVGLNFIVNYGANALAQAVTPAPDGTNTQVNQSGNQYDITGGTAIGTNLFHSFQQFSLPQGQVANFLANPTIRAILARVVGGDASLIDGVLRVSGGTANLYLINPAGILFGQNARLDVPGSFTATTATAIGFTGGGWFNATGSVDYGTLIGSPNQFAFLSNGSLVNAGNLTVNPGQQIALIGGMVLNTGTLTAPGGQILVNAVPQNSLVRLSQPGMLLNLEVQPLDVQSLAATSTQTALSLQPLLLSPLTLPQLLTGGSLSSATGAIANPDGSISLTGSGLAIPTAPGTALVSGRLDASTDVSTPSSGSIGGSIGIFARQIGLVNAQIHASGTNGGGTVRVGGDYQGQGTGPTAQFVTMDANSQINADGLTNGDGGQVIIWADDTTRVYGQITARGGANSGNGGLIETSGKIGLDLAGARGDTTAAQGQVGTWLIDPTDITIDSNPNISGGGPNFFFNSLTSAVLNALDIAAALTTSNVTITTAGTGLGNGDLTLAAAINSTTDNRSLTLSSRLFNVTGGSTINLGPSSNLTVNLNQIAGAPVATATQLGNSLQPVMDAIGAVPGGTTINLGAGTYAVSSALKVDKAVTINGASASSTILSGTNNVQVMHVVSPTTLNQLTITNGSNASDVGGGIVNRSTLAINNSIISNNQVTGSGGGNGKGGGIYNTGNLTMTNTTVSGNTTVGSGGGVSGQGGGIYNSGTLTLVNSTVSGNSTSATGGGNAGQGGGIYNAGTLSLTNTTIANNTTSGSGGTQVGQGSGLFNGGTSTLLNVTIAGNSALTGGSGIWNDNTLTIGNSIVASNLGATGTGLELTNAGTFTSLGHNLFGTNNNSGVTGAALAGTDIVPGTGVLIGHILSPLGNYGGFTPTFRPIAGGLAINAGNNALIPGGLTTDQRGAARIANTTVDIGAVEFGGYTITTTAGSSQTATVNTAFGSNLQATVTEFSTPVAGVDVTFGVPSTGASATFAGSPTLTTNLSGQVNLPISANTIAGTFTVNATAVGAATPATFSLTNSPGAAFSLIPIAGSGQSTTVNTAFGINLQAIVQDQFGNLLNSGTVLFTIPGLGASTQAISPVSIHSNGTINVPIAANAIAGSYSVTATTGTASAQFTLTNQPEPGINFLASSAQAPLPVTQQTVTDPLTVLDEPFSADYSHYYKLDPPQTVTLGQLKGLLHRVAQQRGVKAALIYAVFLPQAITPVPGHTNGAALDTDTIPTLWRGTAIRDDDRLDLVLITPTGQMIRYSTGVTRSQVVSQAKLFRLATADIEDGESFVPLARQLYSWLLEPLEPVLKREGITALIYTLDEGLRTIPIAAMISPKGFVIEDYSLSIIPSFGLLDHRLTSLKNRQALVVGIDKFQTLELLPAVTAEVNLINQLVGGSIALNESATLANILAQKQHKDSGLVHLATHAQFNEGSPNSSYIKLWKQLLTLQQMQSLRWDDPPIDLLVLSACTTALGSHTAELGFAGLAAAAGVRSVLGSLWQVSDIGTMALMSEFYVQLKTAPTRGEALRRAQLALLQGKVRIENGTLINSQGRFDLPANLLAEDAVDFQHPFFWSAFALIGNPW